MKKLTLLILTLFAALVVRADEGMWVPALISSRIADMQSKGFKLTAEDIYSINQASLKDAVILFGGGCTGELISNQGLVLTNHHCGYGQIQSHSSVENDLLTNGFWAMSGKEELPNPGLTVKFLIRMDNVTDEVLAGVDDAKDEEERNAIIKVNSDELRREATKGTHYSASVEPFYYGNQYFIFVYETFEDVRLVAAPPSSIGKFGGEVDNWIWPRHTGDFSIFRIYADKDNKPAKYSPDNVPYTPRKSLTVSLKGVEEDDFTFIYGNPGRTMRYILSDEVDYIENIGDPHKIALRTTRLGIMKEDMDRSDAVRIAYASKYSSVANAWKKWQGEVRGVKRLGTVDKKREAEAGYLQYYGDSEYAAALIRMKEIYSELLPYTFVRDYYSEAYNAIELTRFAKSIKTGLEAGRDIGATADNFYKNYYEPIDRRMAKTVLVEYLNNVNAEYIPVYLSEKLGMADTEEAVGSFVEELFNTSVFTSPEKLQDFLGQSEEVRDELMANDPALRLAGAFDQINTELTGRSGKLSAELNVLYRTYVEGLIEMEKDKIPFPDANLTLRVAYGKVGGYKPGDAMYYEYLTTLDGIMEKATTGLEDYVVPAKLAELYRTKDYGRWAVEGTVPVCFIASNHTTGGNSGSPVLNAKGELIGINFDRTWESTMSDIEFDPEMCRNISVDIRYVLFVMDKVGGVGYLFDEMKFAE